MLTYSSDVYKKLIPRKTLYAKKRIPPIPKPEFIVMYTGQDEFPDRGTYQLSDMFAELDREGLGKLELEVEVYNINNGRNAEMAARSEALKGYSFFISLLREYGKTMDRDSAVERATRECIRQNVLKEFLEEHASELLNMLYGWNEEEARAFENEEAREEGLAIGEAKGIAIGEAKMKKAAKSMLGRGMSVALIAEITGLGKDEIEGLK
jgi:hypothetical protein